MDIKFYRVESDDYKYEFYYCGYNLTDVKLVAYSHVNSSMMLTFTEIEKESISPVRIILTCKLSRYHSKKIQKWQSMRTTIIQ